MAEKVAVFIFLSSTARIPGSVGSKQNIKLCYLFNTSPRPTRTERNVQKHSRKRDRERRETQKERDICRFQLETVIAALKKKNLYEEIVKEINGGVMPDQTDADSNVFDAAFGNSGPTVLEEYQLKVEE